jgi:SAM-dependent methyltransferase
MDREIYARMAELEEEHWWFVARRRIVAQLLDRQIGASRSMRILEAGCGTGGNLSMLAQFGEVAAFEPDPEARRLAERHGPFEILAGRLPDDIPYESASFDVVAALDVLEHVDDDYSALQSLVGRLRRGGLLLLTVPAFPFLWSIHDERHHHRRRYTRKTLCERISGAELVPIQITFFNTLLFPVIAGARICKSVLGLDELNDDSMPPLALNRLLTTVFASERHILERTSLPVGVSLLALARRPMA